MAQSGSNAHVLQPSIVSLEKVSLLFIYRRVDATIIQIENKTVNTVFSYTCNRNKTFLYTIKKTQLFFSRTQIKSYLTVTPKDYGSYLVISVCLDVLRSCFLMLVFLIMFICTVSADFF